PRRRGRCRPGASRARARSRVAEEGARKSERDGESWSSCGGDIPGGGRKGNAEIQAVSLATRSRGRTGADSHAILPHSSIVVDALASRSRPAAAYIPFTRLTSS